MITPTRAAKKAAAMPFIRNTKPAQSKKISVGDYLID
jgi:hypothetical protein